MAGREGPLSEALAVTMYHWPAPGVSTTVGVSEHVPVPLVQPACAAVYDVRMRPPELSSTHSRYWVAPATAFQVYVGVAVVMLPDGATSVAAPGGTALSIVTVCALEVPPPGVREKTVTEAVPAVAMSAAVMAAVSWVLLTKVVVRLAPFQRTTELLTKLVPVAVRVKAAAPAVALVGVTEVSVGAGLLIVKVCALEVPPPGVGEKTVTAAVPAVATSAAVMAAVSWGLVTKVGVRLGPFQRRTEPLVKVVPGAGRGEAA